MSTPAIKCMTQAEFFDFAQAHEERFEFDGVQPMAMTGGSLVHSIITGNILAALRKRLAGGGCQPLGPDAGVQTVGQAIRYPDAVVTCSKISADLRLVPMPVVLFEVLSPSSARTDRVLKLREYAAVATCRSYVIVDPSSMDLYLFERTVAGEQWRVSVLDRGDTMYLPSINVSIPVEEFYEGVPAEKS